MPDTTALHRPRAAQAPGAQDTLATLHALINTCADGAYGFACCADYANSSRHRMFLRQRAHQYDTDVAQLHTLVVRLGGSASPLDPASGALHRGWVAVRGTLCGLRDQSIMAECERGETDALARYQQVLEQQLPSEAGVLVRRQYKSLQASLAGVRALRDAPCADT